HGVRLNHTIVARQERQRVEEPARRYDAVGRTRREEVHEGYDCAADASCGACAFGPGSLTTSGGRDGARPAPPAPPGTRALVWSRGRSPGARDVGWASCPLEGGATAGSTRAVGAAAVGTQQCHASWLPLGRPP